MVFFRNAYANGKNSLPMAEEGAFHRSDRLSGQTVHPAKARFMLPAPPRSRRLTSCCFAGAGPFSKQIR